MDSPFILVPGSDSLVLTLHEFKFLTANKLQSSSALWKCRTVVCFWHLLNGFQFSVSKLISLPLYSINETNKNGVLLLVSGVIVEESDDWSPHCACFNRESTFHPEFLCRSLFSFLCSEKLF